jgi:hypothetical protein
VGDLVSQAEPEPIRRSAQVGQEQRRFAACALCAVLYYCATGRFPVDYARVGLTVPGVSVVEVHRAIAGAGGPARDVRQDLAG